MYDHFYKVTMTNKIRRELYFFYSILCTDKEITFEKFLCQFFSHPTRVTEYGH